VIKSRQLLVAALCGVGIVSTAFASEGAAPANPFKPGDEIFATSAAKLMRGDSILATVNAGQTLRALKIEGPWVGTTVTANGKTIGGWVWSKQLSTPRDYQAMRRTARRSYTYQPAPVSGQRTYAPPFVMGETRYGRSYWRSDRKIVGY
jgi:hypothetical protein